MKKNKPRNHVARNPLLRKGGPHVRAKSGERFASKRKVSKAVREWQGSRSSRRQPHPEFLTRCSLRCA